MFSKIVSLVAVGFLLAAGAARADWTVAETARHGGRKGLVTRFEVTAENSETSESARLQFAVFDSNKATLRVLDQPAEPRASLAATMRSKDCLAGVNGGYFDPNYGLVGLLISEGRVEQAQQKAKLLSGVVSVVKGRVRVQRSAEFSLKTKPTAARQCGPFLVDGGKAVPGLNNSRKARRTFVLTMSADRAAIGFCSHLTLSGLASLLATPQIFGSSKVQRALNLDGGSSSGFWFVGEDGAFSISEKKTVRDFLAIVPR